MLLVMKPTATDTELESDCFFTECQANSFLGYFTLGKLMINLCESGYRHLLFLL